MNILNEKIEIIAEVRLGVGMLMKYCHIRYEDDGGSRYPVLIIERGDSPLTIITETSFVIEKDFKDFAKKVYLRLDEIEVAESVKIRALNQPYNQKGNHGRKIISNNE